MMPKDIPVRANFDLLRDLIEDAGVDTLLTYGSRNSCYLAGRVGVERWIHGPYDVVPPFVALSFSGESFVRGVSWMHEDIPADTLHGDVTPESGIEQVIRELKHRGLATGTVGVDKQAMPAIVFEMLKAGLPDTHFVGADSILLRARSRKTRSEVALMQRNIDVAEAAWVTVKDMVRDGLDFHELCLAWAQAVVAGGSLPVYAAPIDLMYRRAGVPRHSGPRPGVLRWPSEIEPGIIYRLDFCTVHQGYFSDQKYNICLGEPSDEGRRWYEEDCRRQRFMMDFIKPGTTKRELHEACCGDFSNLEENPYYCHGVGMDMHEEPRVGTNFADEVGVWEEVTFETGAVLALEPSWLVEDAFVLEERGFRRMGRRDELEIF